MRMVALSSVSHPLHCGHSGWALGGTVLRTVERLAAFWPLPAGYQQHPSPACHLPNTYLSNSQGGAPKNVSRQCKMSVEDKTAQCWEPLLWTQGPLAVSHCLGADVSRDLLTLFHGLAKDVGIEIRLCKITVHVFSHKSASFNPFPGLLENTA